ncbi:sodium/proline symporter [Nitrosococcus wardiae]|uniref:Sodium/proline symporter n=1 Tax=Nitrosococcus wardiae TaxID=1814290 RepID=A0A4P7C3T9_9GAMM|nr:sodium/proline symporter [Nitrosococcus wardiae]QBQ55616.1 sodium/proline symporter [Nitrosococcus wardiae]
MVIVFSFLFFLAVFAFIGLLSARKAQGNRSDYYVASNSVKPWLVGLSAVATNNSGYMFIGVIGYTYTVGLASIWLVVGWILGDFLASQFIHRHFREATARTEEVTYGGVLSQWYGTELNRLRRTAGLITVIFLGTYAAAQLNAGSKALYVLFDWPFYAGALIGAILVVGYCFAGGIRASIWTDAAQSFVMFGAMLTLLYATVTALGGPKEAWAEMGEIEGFLNWTPTDTLVPGVAGLAFFVLGWLFGGFSVAGQPHVMVRFMALDDPNHMTRARLYYYLWYTSFYFMATGVGMLSRVYLPESQNFDPELALPTIGLQLLPDMLVGLLLAGIFAATMSTADSLVLACSAAFTHDLLPQRLENMGEIKTATVVVTALALAIALSNNEDVFTLVILSWSFLASAFVPLLLIYIMGGKPTDQQALTILSMGVGVAIAWRWLEFHHALYEGMPGILAGLATYGVLRLFGKVDTLSKGESSTK